MSCRCLTIPVRDCVYPPFGSSRAGLLLWSVTTFRDPPRLLFCLYIYIPDFSRIADLPILVALGANGHIVHIFRYLGMLFGGRVTSHSLLFDRW